VRRILLKSKIHRAVVTEADLHYEGSLTIDVDLMRAADIRPYEQVQIYNVTSGTRLTTYAIEGEAGSGVLCANGAAAHLVTPGDVIIIATYAEFEEAELDDHEPTVLLVDHHNRAVSPVPVESA
jgi:aspartate 1-decarboxylase